MPHIPYAVLFNGEAHRLYGIEPGDDTRAAAKRIREAARYRGITVDVHVAHDEKGKRFLYVRNLSLDTSGTGDGGLPERD